MFTKKKTRYDIEQLEANDMAIIMNGLVNINCRESIKQSIKRKMTRNAVKGLKEEELDKIFTGLRSMCSAFVVEEFSNKVRKRDSRVW